MYVKRIYHSEIILKSFSEENTLIGGYPAKILKLCIR